MDSAWQFIHGFPINQPPAANENKIVTSYKGIRRGGFCPISLGELDSLKGQRNHSLVIERGFHHKLKVS